MQSRGLRMGLVVVAAAVAVGLFVVLRGDDDDEEAPTTVATETQVEDADAADGGKQKPEKPEIPTIVVKNGEPVGGVQELSFDSGDQIEFRVSADAPAEVHFHGYDVIMDVEPGKPVTFDVPADIEGGFEVELEETAVQIAEIEVTPG